MIQPVRHRDENRLPSESGPAHARLIAALLLLFAVALNFHYLLPQAVIQTPRPNDDLLHLLALEGTASALAYGQNATDFWLGTISLGYPLFHHYQHLAYLPAALLHQISGGTLSLAGLFYWTQLLLLSLFPLSIYWSMRRFGFDCLTAAMAGLLAPLLSTNNLFGFDFASYVWRGSGLYTQLWGMLLLPPALAQGYRALQIGRGYFWAVLLLAATLLTHLVLGYIAIISLLVLALIVPCRAPAPRPDQPARLGQGGPLLGLSVVRLILLVALVALVAAYFVVPFWQDGAFMNRSVWEKPEKYDSYGYEWVLGTLVTGDLFDFGRFPWLTLLVAAGLVMCLRRWREGRYRVPAVLFILWLLLYFGRPTWGVLLDLLPMSGDMHLHRLIAGVHLGGIYLMGIGLAWPWRWVLARKKATYIVAALGLSALILYPVYQERAKYLDQNTEWLVESRDALAAEQQDLKGLYNALRELPPGRVYAGLGANWGREYQVGYVPMYALLNDAGFDMVGYLYHALSLNADIMVHFDEARLEHYDLFNVRYVVAPADHAFPDFVRPIGTFGRHRLYRVETSGYFELVDAGLTFAGTRSEFYPAAEAWLFSPSLAGKVHPVLLLNGAPAGEGSAPLPLSLAPGILPQLPPAPESRRGRVLSETVQSGALAAQVEVERPSMLLLKVTYHPGWRATVDGVAAEPVMLMPSYVGLAMAPGMHQVHLEYRPGPLRGYLMVLGLVTLLLVGLAEWRRKDMVRLAQPAWVRVGGTATAATRTVSSAASAKPVLAARNGLAQHGLYLALLVLMVLLAGLPLFQLKIMSGHDSPAYLPRQVEFYEGLTAGQLFPRWAPDLSGGHGQPFFNFSPPFFYYLAALFRALGSNFVNAQSLTLLMLLLCSGLAMYVLAGEFLGRRGGLVAAVAYIFAPYLLVDLYVRHALAEFSAFAFMPLAFWGLYRFARGGRYRFLVVSASTTALVTLSSNQVAVMCLPALGLWLAWLAWTTKGRRGAVLWRGVWCLGLGLALAAFFWLPALAERDLVHSARTLAGYLNYQNHFVYLFQLVYSPWGYGLSVAGSGDGMSFAVGPVHLLLCAVAVWLLWRNRGSLGPPKTFALFFLVLFALAAFFATNASQFVWAQLSLLQYLQFSWRFLSLVAISTAFLCGLPFIFLGAHRERLARWLMAGMLAVLFVLGFPKAHPESFLGVADADFSPQAIAARYVSATTSEEFEPIWVQQRPKTAVTEPVSLLSGQGEISALQLSPTRREFHAVITEQARLRLNTFYFPGWAVYVDGQERPPEYDNPQGVMELSLEPGDHQLKLEFLDTPVRRVGTWISLLALAALVLIPWLGRRRGGATDDENAQEHPCSPYPASSVLSRMDSLEPGNLGDEAGQGSGVPDGVHGPPNAASPMPPGEAVLGRGDSGGETGLAPGVPGGATRFRVYLGIYLVLLAVYLASAAGHFFSTDHVAVYLTAQSLVERGSLAIRYMNDAVAGVDGRYYAVFGLGQSLLSIPFYLLGVLVDRLSSPELRAYWSGVDLGQWGGTVPIFFVSLVNQFVSPLICVAAYAFCRKVGFSATRSLAVTLMLGFATAVWVYARDSFQHPLQALCLLLSIYILFAHRDEVRLRDALGSGLAMALGVLTRSELLLMVPVLAVYLASLVLSRREALALRGAPSPEGGPALDPQPSPIPAPTVDSGRPSRRRGRLPQYLLTFASPVVVVLLVMAYVDTVKFGNPLAVHPLAIGEGWNESLTGLYGYLFSPGRSVFLYSPPIILALFAFPRFYRQFRREAILLAVASAMYLMLYSLYGYWHGGWCFGPRHMLFLVPLWAIPIGCFLTSRRRIALAVCLTVLGVGVQILGVTIGWSYVYWDWSRMALNPEDGYLFYPSISAIPMHLNALLAGRNVDLWMLWVYRQFSGPVFLMTAAVPLLMLGGGVALLRSTLGDLLPGRRQNLTSTPGSAGGAPPSRPGWP